MPPNRFESEVESFLEGSHGDRTHIKRADHPRLHHYAGRYSQRSSPVEWCNRFVSFGLGYALSWSGVSSCWVGCGVSRDLVRMSRLR